MNIYKTLFLLFVFLFFVGCGSKKQETLYTNKVFDPTNKQFVSEEYNVKNDSILKDVIKNDKIMFPNDEEDIEDTNVLEISDEKLVKSQEHIKEYSDVKTVYLYVAEHRMFNNFNLTALDYLKLYKILRLNQEKVFTVMKVDLINRFMMEIENNKNFDLDSVYLTLLEEKIDKIDILIQELNSRELK